MIRRICFYAAAIKFEDNFLWIEVDAMTCKQTFHSLYEFDRYILQYEQPLWQYHRWPMQKVLETHRDALTVWITLTLDVRLQSLIQVMIAVLIQDSVRIVWEKQRSKRKNTTSVTNKKLLQVVKAILGDLLVEYNSDEVKRMWQLIRQEF